MSVNGTLIQSNYSDYLQNQLVNLERILSLLPHLIYNVTENSLLFPIPYAEMQLNPLLTQNKGY